MRDLPDQHAMTTDWSDFNQNASSRIGVWCRTRKSRCLWQKGTANLSDLLYVLLGYFPSACVIQILDRRHRRLQRHIHIIRKLFSLHTQLLGICLSWARCGASLQLGK